MKKLLVILLTFIPFHLHGFKVNTHALVGQQVINDLADDGKITIKTKNGDVTLDVPNTVKEAILSNQDLYLMGTIGPDAAPDLVVGQNIIHPGSEGEAGKWDVNNWLTYMLANMTSSQKETAYTYGFLSHISADVFAHTYVNQYTGDHFSIADGETLVEQRHVALEGYIDGHAPTFKNHQNDVIANSAYELIELDNEYGEIIRDKMILDNSVADQYRRSSYSNHLYAFKELRDFVYNLEQDPIWKEIDKEVIKYIVFTYSGYELTNEEAELLSEGNRKLHEFINVEVVDEVFNFHVQTQENIARWRKAGFNSVVDAIEDLNNTREDLQSKRNSLAGKVLDLESRILTQGCSVATSALGPLGLTQTLLSQDIDMSTLVNPLKQTKLVAEAANEWINEKVCDAVTHTWLEKGGWSCNWLTGCKPKWITKSIEKQVCDEPEPRLDMQAHFTREEWNNETFHMDKDDAHDIDRDEMLKVWSDVLNLSEKFVPEDKFVLITASETSIPLIIKSDNVISVQLTLDGFYIYRSENYDDYHAGKRTLVLHAENNSDFTHSQDLDICKSFENSLNAGHDLLVTTIDQLEDEAFNLATSEISKLNQLNDEITKAEEEVQKFERALLDTYSDWTARPNPLESLIYRWRLDIDEALAKYALAVSETMVNTMDKTNDHPYQPIEDWFSTYLTDMISPVGDNGALSAAFEIQESANTSLKLLLTDPVTASIRTKIEELKDHAKNKAKDVLIAELEAYLPPEHRDFLTILKKSSVDSVVLNDYFTKQETISTKKGLFRISDMADRVNSDMRVANGEFDLNSFSPFYNAVQLSKLSLLDNAGINSLLTQMGVDSSVAIGVDNLVATAFTNIDANHQWMETAPPTPRSSEKVNTPEEPYSFMANYNKSFSTEKGFLLWSNNGDEFIRDSLFRSIFIGPVSEGIDAPEINGFSPIVRPEYEAEYDPTEDNPFPSYSAQ